jgi:hypothetical protein
VVATQLRRPVTLSRDWRKAARFYARFGITQAMFRHGVPLGPADKETESPETWRPRGRELGEKAARVSAPLPNPEPNVYAWGP